METSHIIGFLAAFICSISMAPQVIKIYISKDTKGLSLWAFTAMATGLFLWLVYGLLIKEPPVVLGNAVGLSFAMYIIVMKIRHG
jgi:MtN3 and saliva related transmembrane protein